MVVASHPVAAEAGAAVLRQGGNAVDAAVTVQCTLGVVEPLASGFGGGAFWLIFWATDGSLVALDSRETAPAGATADMFLGDGVRPMDENDRAASGLAVGAPGALAGLVMALERYGTISLADALATAIQIAEQGVPASTFMVGRLGLGSSNNRNRLERSPAAAALFLPAGRPLAEGAQLVQPDLGGTLRDLARQGPGLFYHGELGQTIMAEVRARGGRLTMDDLGAYRPLWREPLLGRYRQWSLATFPPPGSGLYLLEMLGILEGFSLKVSGHNQPATLHLLIETIRKAHADRVATLGDPDHVAVPTRGLLDEGYLAMLRKSIDPGRSAEVVEAGDVWKNNDHTTHFTVADCWGNVVAATATIESLFGSGIMAPGTGLLLNNQLSDFDALPGGPNQARPGARPASSMAPTLVLEGGKPVFTLGSPGGVTISASILQVLSNLLDHGLGLQEAVNAPRVFAGEGRRVAWEEGLGNEARQALAQLGHELITEPRIIGTVQCLALDWASGTVAGAADPRRQGAAI